MKSTLAVLTLLLAVNSPIASASIVNPDLRVFKPIGCSLLLTTLTQVREGHGPLLGKPELDKFFTYVRKLDPTFSHLPDLEAEILLRINVYEGALDFVNAFLEAANEWVFLGEAEQKSSFLAVKDLLVAGLNYIEMQPIDLIGELTPLRLQTLKHLAEVAGAPGLRETVSHQMATHPEQWAHGLALGNQLGRYLSNFKSGKAL